MASSNKTLPSTTIEIKTGDSSSVISFRKMLIKNYLFILVLCSLCIYSVYLLPSSQSVNVDPIAIEVSWAAHDYDLHTIPTLQLVTNPLVSRQFSPVSEAIFSNLKQLDAEYARYAVWFPYPKLAVAELDPPSGLYQCANVGENMFAELSCERGGGVVSKIDFASFGTATGACGKMNTSSCHASNSSDVVGQACLGKQKCSVNASDILFGDPCYGTVKRLLIQIECNPPQNNTYWNFTYMDPMFEDFLAATESHSRVISFSTQPAWLFQQDTPHLYPDNATAVDWGYIVGTQLVDESMQQLGDYYGRLVAWYSRGGFFDEYGMRHESGYQYDWDYTEIFNEIEGEHHMPIEYYTRAYDAVVQGIRRHTNNTQMKFVGMALERHNEFDYYRYFLNHSNHAPGIPLDMISYHFYAIGTDRTNATSYEGFFPQLDAFTVEVQQIELIRKALSPDTRTDIDELGVILPDDNDPNAPMFPYVYWNAAAALYAYAWGQLSRQGIDVVGHSQLVGYPQLNDLQLQPQYPSVALLNWTTGEGTAKYWTSKLLIETADVDIDQAVVTNTTDAGNANIYAQGFIGNEGRRWVLLVNKRFTTIDVSVNGCAGGLLRIIDEESGFGPATNITLTSDRILLTSFAVAVVHMPTSTV